MARRKIYKVAHAEPGKFWLNYILLPYGEYYEKTKRVLDATPGETLRFFEGPDVTIESVFLIACDKTCDFLCMMRYGITWDKAFAKWQSYARLEGHGKDILSRAKCILVVYENSK